MASIYRRKEKKSCVPSWRLQFRGKVKRSREIESFSGVFNTKEEAEEFAKEWEPIFFKEGKKAVKYDALDNIRKRKWGDRY